MNDLVLGRGLLLAALLLAPACGTDAAKTATAPPPAPVTVGVVLRRTVPVTIRTIGNVVATETVAVRSRVEGPIVAVHVKDGADVAKGQTLFSIDPAPFQIALDRAQAQLDRDKALLTKADDDVARYEKLVAKEYVTREQYESAVAQAASLRATIRVDESAAAQARLDLSYCTIAAPIAGRAGRVDVDAGNLVKANDDPPLVTLLAIIPVKVGFAVPERYVGALRARLAAARVPVRAIPRGETGDGHEGALSFVDNAVDRSTGTIRLEALFPNRDRALWPGQFVEVALDLSDEPDAVLAPTAAVQSGQNGSFVFVVGADGVAQVRPVVVERTVGDQSVVSSGLEGGETVITDGQLRVVPGAKVAVATGEKPGA